jgi:hypothetical protein
MRSATTYSINSPWRDLLDANEWIREFVVADDVGSVNHKRKPPRCFDHRIA